MPLCLSGYRAIGLRHDNPYAVIYGGAGNCYGGTKRDAGADGHAAAHAYTNLHPAAADSYQHAIDDAHCDP